MSFHTDSLGFGVNNPTYTIQIILSPETIAQLVIYGALILIAQALIIGGFLRFGNRRTIAVTVKNDSSPQLCFKCSSHGDAGSAICHAEVSTVMKQVTTTSTDSVNATERDCSIKTPPPPPTDSFTNNIQQSEAPVNSVIPPPPPPPPPATYRVSAIIPPPPPPPPVATVRVNAVVPPPPPPPPPTTLPAYRPSVSHSSPQFPTGNAKPAKSPGIVLNAETLRSALTSLKKTSQSKTRSRKSSANASLPRSRKSSSNGLATRSRRSSSNGLPTRSRRSSNQKEIAKRGGIFRNEQLVNRLAQIRQSNTSDMSLDEWE